MANARAPLASHGLEDLHVPLTSIRSASAPPAQTQRAHAAFNMEPMTDLPSLNRPAKRRLVHFPLRLAIDQIEALDKLKTERGIVPSELVRDLVDHFLQRNASPESRRDQTDI